MKTAEEKVKIIWRNAVVVPRKLEKPRGRSAWEFVLYTSPGGRALKRSVVSRERVFELAWSACMGGYKRRR